MDLRAPSWKLKKTRCTCICGGEGFLYLITCPSCGHIAAVCDEVGTVYPNPLDLSKPEEDCGYISNLTSFPCPKCGKAELRDFRNSTPDEIQAIGLVPGDYE